MSIKHVGTNQTVDLVHAQPAKPSSPVHEAESSKEASKANGFNLGLVGKKLGDIWAGIVGKGNKADEPKPEYSVEKFVDNNSFVLNQDGTHSKLTDTQRTKLVESLKEYDARTLEKLEGEGMTIAIVDHEHPPKGGYPGGIDKWITDAGGKNPAGAYYTPDGKAIAVRADQIYKGTFIHEVAHAVDDMLEADVTKTHKNPYYEYKDYIYRSEKDPALGKLFDEYKARSNDPKQKDKVWSTYALNNRAEYVAEGITSYLENQATRDELKAADPKMYTYVENLLNEAADKKPVNPPVPEPKSWWQKIKDWFGGLFS